MSLSVSSFPAAPPNLVRQPKWQITPSLKSSGRFLGTLLSKRSLPSLKGIGHIAKAHVKRGIIRQRANVSRSRWMPKHHSSHSRSSIRSSSIVIDITPISNDDKYSSARSSDDVDASSLNSTIKVSLSPTISPPALSSPTAATDFPAISSADSVKAPYQSSVQSLVGDSAHSRESEETVVQHPAKEREEVASDSEPHDPQPPNSEITTPLPISPSLKTQPPTGVPPLPSTEGRNRSHSASTGIKASASKTVPPTRPRYKSETEIGLPRLTTTITPSEPIPQPPATNNAHTSESTSTKRQRQQRRESIFKRARARSAGASSKSADSNKAMESPPLRARMFSMRSLGSRLSVNGHHRPITPPPLPSPLHPFSLSATALVPVPKSSPEQMDVLQAPPHLRPNTASDVAASPPSRWPPSPAVGPGLSDDASEQSPLPSTSSVDKGLWLRVVAVPHAESWDGDQQRRRPRTAPEAVLMAGW